MAHERNLRKGRYSINNGTYLITFATKNRKLIFRDLYFARIAVQYLNNSHYTDTLAFVVMPNHVHWLMQLRTAKSLSQVVKATKSAISKSINRQTSQKGTIWQAGFHDHAVRNENALREIARYVVANPIRAKLVKNVGDYPHWDAVWLTDSRLQIAPTKAIHILEKANQARFNRQG